MRVLVTGGGGFLGSHIVEALLERGDEVGSLTRSDQPELRERGVAVHLGDIGEREDVRRALGGYEHVIHTAAMVNPWGNREAFYRTNVTGTEVLLEESAAAGVERFVFTSSPSAIFDGTPLVNAPRSTPYPRRFPAAYGETKALSEQLVSAAHGRGGMQTVSLRPQLMWGPGDPHLFPLVIEQARAGRLKIIGDGRARVDLTFIDNAAAAHLDALDALGKEAGDATHPGGKAYFISNDEPVVLWEFIERVLGEVGVEAPSRRVPRALAAWSGAACEALWEVLGRDDEPPVSRFVVLKMSTDQWYDMGPARRDLGYAPRVSMEEGFERWRASLSA